MAPIRTTGQLLASTLNSHSTSSSLATRSLQIRHSLSTIPVPSSPSHTPVTPSISFHRVTRVLLEHFNRKRDDGDSTTTISNKHLNLIFPIIVGAIFLASVWGCTRDHFRKGGTYKTYAKSWYTAVKFVLLITIFLPFTILGCYLNCRKARNTKRNGNVLNGRGGAAAPAVAVNPLPGSGAPPPPMSRPQMPLDPVVVMPDLPDQEDPDAVLALPPPPPPIMQRNETTDEATDRFLQENER